MEMLSTVSGIFGSEGGMQENEIDELERELKEQKHIEDVALFHQSNSTEIFSVDKVDFTFDVSKLALSLYNNTTNVDSKDLEKQVYQNFVLMIQELNCISDLIMIWNLIFISNLSQFMTPDLSRTTSLLKSFRLQIPGIPILV